MVLSLNLPASQVQVPSPLVGEGEGEGASGKSTTAKALTPTLSRKEREKVRLSFIFENPPPAWPGGEAFVVSVHYRRQWNAKFSQYVQVWH